MSKVDQTKQQYSAVNVVHRNFGAIGAAVSVLAFVSGFVVAGAFTRR